MTQPKRKIPAGSPVQFKYELWESDGPICVRLWKQGYNHHARKDPLWGVGERNPNSVLVVNDVVTIRDSSLGSTALAKHYGVTRQTIRRIRKKELWKHI